MKKNIVLTLTLIAVSSQAFAQTKKNDREISLEGVEVVANTPKQKNRSVNRLDVPLKLMPMSVSTLKTEKLEIRGIQTMEEATRFIPGVRINTMYGSFQRLSIRGFANSTMMMDGIRNERSTFNSYPISDLTAVESIELLKGAASVMHGHSIIGGVLNVVRKRPTAERSLYTRLSYGSYNDRRTTFGMGGKLAGPVNYYANFNYADQDGWRDLANERLSGYFALGADFTEKDRLDVRFGFNNDFYATEIGLPDLMSADVYNTDGSLYLKKGEMLPGLDHEARYNSESDFFYNRGHNVTATYTHRFNDKIRLENRLYYTYNDIDYFSTEDLAYVTSKDPIYPHYQMNRKGEKEYIDLSHVRYDFPLRFAHLDKTIGNQLDFIGKFNTGSVKHNYLVGYGFSYFTTLWASGYNLGTDVTGPGLTGHVSVTNPQTMGHMDTKFSKGSVRNDYNHSLYFQDLIEFNDKLKWLIAGRYDNYITNGSPSFAMPSGDRFDYEKPNKDDYNKIVNNAFSYRTGLVYLPVEEVSIFGSLSSFFKPIRTFYNANTIYIDGGGNTFIPEQNKEIFKPETGYQAEVGVKYAPSSRLSLSANAFHILRKNSTQNLGSFKVEEASEMVQKTITGQVGRVASTGFDVEVAYNPLAELSLNAGYSYTYSRVLENATIKDESLTEYIPEGTANKGKRLPYIPQSTFFAMADYTIPRGIFKDLGALLSVNFMDETYRDAANEKTFDAHWLTDVALYYKLKNNVRLSLNVNNLFNKSYYNQALGDQLVPSMPRNFQVSITYKL